MSLSHSTTVNGYVIFDGTAKLAVVTTKHTQGLARDGQVVYEVMPTSSWTVHLTSPVISLDVFESIGEYASKLDADGNARP